jgi:phthiocerol/phenolphthiocerol synthesis type-I polyketide synthase A
MLGLDAATTESLIADYPQVTLGIYNSPRQTVIAGPTEQIDELINRVRARDRFASRVNIEVAPHNPAMDALQPAMRSELADLAPRTPSIPIISTTYEDLDTRPAFDAEHWATNMRNPVRFQHAITAAATENHNFIEISAHPLLTQAILETLHTVQHGSKYASVGSLQRDTDDTIVFRTNLNTVRTTPPQTPHPPEPHPQIPTTPWHHTHHWITTRAVTSQVPDAQRHNGLPAKEPAGPGYRDGLLDDWCHQLAWPVSPLPSAETSSSGGWLVVAEGNLATGLAGVLGPESRVDVLAPAVLAEGGDAAALLDALRGVDNVLYAPPVPNEPLDVGLAYQLFHQVRGLAARMAAIDSPPKLFIVTSNAQPVFEGDRANPGHAVLWGLGRTLALEHPEIWGGIIDLDTSVPSELAVQYLRDEARTADGDDQVVYRSGVRHVPRLQRRTLPAESPVELGSDSQKNTSQLVIGATGNVGPHLIRQLAKMGAKTIVAVSRNPGSRLKELAQSLASNGTSLIEVAADATDEVAMTTLFDRFGTDLPPLEGIYLAAFAGRPVLLSEMTDDDVAAMFRPKLDAATLLHRLSLKMPVRQFVLFSSISGLTGSRWLAHYTATSTFLDTLAYARRVMGLPATTVNWGLWKSLADGQQDASQVSIESGLQPMPDEVAIGALPLVMSPAAGVHSVVVAADWPLLAAAYRTRGSLRIVDDLLSAESGDTARSLTAARDWSQMSPTDVRDELEKGLRSIVSRELRVPESELENDRPLAELGLNSLMALAIRREAEQIVGLELSATMLFNYPTVASLADHLTKVVAPQADSGVDEIAALSASAGSVLDSLFDSIESTSVPADGPA